MNVADLDTPVLLVDVDALDANIACMKDMAAAAGLRYRPHAKTHKSAEIARRQIAAGAAGVCCAKLGEAEVLAAAGIRNLLITTPVVGDSKIGRMLQARTQALIAVVADDADNVAALGRMAQTAGMRLDVLVEIDVGQARCGVQTPAAAADLAKRIADHPWLDFAGVQGYQGRIQMIEAVDARRGEVESAEARLAAAIAAIEGAGLEVPVRTGGGTGTAPFDLADRAYTEIQPGSYVFMDTRYGAIGWPGASAQPFAQALQVLTTVISRPVADRAVVDAGLKAASSDHGPPAVTGRDDAVFAYGGDEHGELRLADGGAVPWKVGDKLRLTPSHCDTTVNLYDQYIVVQGETVVDVWPIDARGRTQ